MEEKYLLGFSLLPAIGPIRFKKIQNSFSSLEEAWHSNETCLLKAGISPKIASRITETKKKLNLEQQFEIIQNQKIQILGWENAAYPQKLKEIHSAPFVLFCRGNLSLLNQSQIAVVGTRRPTAYGAQVIEKLVPEICQAGLAITSGLAQGIDSLAHQATLNCLGSTLAVLGSALDEKILQQSHCYKLAQEILSKNGLIISEYPPGFTGNKTTFPARNRIISGLSLGVLVVEAGERSGSLITANYALEHNRELFAIPGSIFSPYSLTTNRLLQQGAKIVTSAQDILESLELSLNKNSRPQEVPTFQDPLAEKIYHQLSFEPLHINKIAQALEINLASLSAKLSLMEMQGLAKNVGGGMFIRN